MGRTFYEGRRRWRGARLLGGFLARMKLEGRIEIRRPHRSPPTSSLALRQNRMLKGRLVNYIPEPTPAEVDAEVATAVATFMAASAPRASRGALPTSALACERSSAEVRPG
ncbi:TetR/AcrR family transcriptional regulator C-terminal domain-containing protein [Caulobacter segnis]